MLHLTTEKTKSQYNNNRRQIYPMLHWSPHIHTTSGCGGKTHLHVQLNTGTDLTEVTLSKKYRHGFDIHREMGQQSVHSRPIFTSHLFTQVKDEICTTTHRQLSARYKLEVFEHTGVPAQEYDILTVPCGIRKQALPFRNYRQ